MRRLSSRAIRAAGTAALALALTSQAAASCDDEYTEVQTEYGEICVRHNDATGEDVRVDDDECDDGGHFGAYWFYVYQSRGYSPPAVGSLVTPGSGSTVRPAAGTFARVPASGGFGTTRMPVGS